MTDYRVRWEIHIDADTPDQAARIAREIQRDAQSLATFYEVDEVGAGKTWTVDLWPVGRTTTAYSCRPKQGG